MIDETTRNNARLNFLMSDNTHLRELLENAQREILELREANTKLENEVDDLSTKVQNLTESNVRLRVNGANSVVDVKPFQVWRWECPHCHEVHVAQSITVSSTLPYLATCAGCDRQYELRLPR